MTELRPNRRRQLVWQQPVLNWYRRNRRAFAAFAIPAVVLAIGFLIRGVWPIDNRNVLTVDLYHQYAPFLADLRDRLLHRRSLLYSWNGGLGVNYWSLFAYYLASPFNILTLLLPASMITESVFVLVLIKIGLGGACFHLFLKGVWRTENNLMTAIAICYPLSAFQLAYYWNIMWLDGLFLLPLIMLGIYRLVRERKGLLYAVCLGLTIFSNYYIAFFICLFTALFFLLAWLSEGSRRISQKLLTLGHFALYSLLGAGLSAILAIPTYLSLRLTSAAGDRMPSDLQHYFDLFDYLGQHLMMLPPTIRDGMPNLYCSVLMLVLVPAYFFSRSISLRRKVLHLSLLAVLIFSFNINTLNFIWHGFHFPNQLPYRNSFLYVVVILSIAYPALRRLREFSGKQIGAFFGAAMLVVLLTQKLLTPKPEWISLIATLVFLMIYAVALTYDRTHRVNRRDWSFAVLMVVVAELFLNTMVTLHRIDVSESLSWSVGYSRGAEVSELRDTLARIADEEKGQFYRLETLSKPLRTANEGFIHQYPSASIFSSTMPTKPVRLMANLGLHSNGINSYQYQAAAPVFDALMGIRYLIWRGPAPPQRLYTVEQTTEHLTVLVNPYALGLGYLVPADARQWHSSYYDPLATQNSMLRTLSGNPDDAYKPLRQSIGTLSNMTIGSSAGPSYRYQRPTPAHSSQARIRIENTQDQHIYIFTRVSANDPDLGYVRIVDDPIETRPTSTVSSLPEHAFEDTGPESTASTASARKIDFDAKRSTMIELGCIPAGAAVELTLSYPPQSPDNGTFDIFAYALDQSVLTHSVDLLQQGHLTLEQFKDGYAEGTVKAAEGQDLLLTIPYDAGWQIEIDGRKADYQALDQSLILVPLTPGTHRVRLHYTPLGYWLGLAVSILSLLLLILLEWLLWPRLRRRRLYDTLQSDLSGSADYLCREVIVMKKQLEFYRCAICGNIVLMVEDGGGELVCCGEPMKLLVAGTFDAAREKHVPECKRDGDRLDVVVGSVLHPMEEKHYIQWICVDQAGKTQIAWLQPGQEPKASFIVAPGSVTVYEYCNLHSLWKAEAE